MDIIQEIKDVFKPGMVRDGMIQLVKELKDDGYHPERLDHPAESMKLSGDFDGKWFFIGLDPDGNFYLDGLNR